MLTGITKQKNALNYFIEVKTIIKNPDVLKTAIIRIVFIDYIKLIKM